MLRISDFVNYASKHNEFDAMRKAYKLAINMSKPIDFAICGDANMYIYYYHGLKEQYNDTRK